MPASLSQLTILEFVNCNEAFPGDENKVDLDVKEIRSLDNSYSVRLQQR